MVNRNVMPYIYWCDRAVIEHAQDRILIWSIVYYEMDDNLVSDATYTDECMQLVEFMRDHPESAEQSRYWYVFNDFDGNTGCDLVHRLNRDDYKRLAEKAAYVLGRRNFKKRERDAKKKR